MKRSLSLLVLLAGLMAFLPVNTYAAITAQATGAWSSTTPNAPWPGGTIPTVADDVIIPNGVTVTVTDTGRTCKNMTVQDGGTLSIGGFAFTIAGTTTVGAGTSGTISITSATSTKTFTGAVTINNGAAITETAAATLSFGSDVTINTGGTLTEAVAATVGIAGSLKVDGTYTASTGVHTFSGAATKTFSGNTTISIPNVTVSGTYQNNGTLTVNTALAGSGTLTQGSGSTLNLGGTSATFVLSASANVNTVNYTGAAQIIKVVVYNSLGLSGSAAKTMTSVATVNSNLTISGSCTATLPALATVGGNMSLSGTATATPTLAGGLTITGNLSVGDGTTFTAGALPLTVNGTTTVGTGTSGLITISSATGTKTFTGNVTINGGTGKINETAAAALSFGGDVTINGTGTLAENGAAVVGIAGSLANSGTYTASTGTHTFSGASKTLSGTLSIATMTVTGTYTNNGTLTSSTLLTVTSPGTLANNGTITATASLAGTGGLTQLANSTLNIGGASTITTLDASTYTPNTVNYTGAAQSVLGVNYSILGLAGSGAKTLAVGTTTISSNLLFTGTATATAVANLSIGGDLNIGAGTVFNLSTFTADRASSGGTLTVGAGSALRIGGTGTTLPANYTTHSIAATSTNEYSGASQNVAVPNSAQNYGNLILSGSGTKTLLGTIGVAGNLTLNGGTFDLGSYTANRTTAGGTLTLASGAGLKIGSGTLPSNYTTHSINAMSTVEYDGAAQSVALPNSSQNYGTLVLSGSGAKTLPALATISSNLTLSGTASAATVAALAVGGNLNIGDGAALTVPGYTIGVTGSTTVGGGASGALSITSATGAKTFTGPVTINNGASLAETSGSAAALTFGSNVTVNAGGTLTEDGAAVVGIAGSLQVDGTYNASTGVHTFSGAATKTISGATALAIPSVTVTGVYQNNGTLTVNTALAGAGSLANTATGTLNLGGTVGITTLTATAVGNTVNYTGSSQTLKVVAYHHLILSGGAETFGAITTVAGNLTLTNTATASAGANLAVTGNLNINDGTTLTVPSTFTLAVTGATTIGNGVSGTLASTGTGARTFTGALLIRNGAALTESAIAALTFGAGGVTVNSGGTLTEYSSSTVGFAGGLQVDGAYTASTGAHTFTGTSKVIGGATPISIPSFTMTGSWTNNGTLTITTTGAGAGTLTQAANATLNIAAAPTTAFTLVATATGNTVNYTGVAQTVKNVNYYNLGLGGSGVKTLQTGTTAIGGNLVFSGTATATTVVGLSVSGNMNVAANTALTVGAFNMSVSGVATMNGTVTVNAGGVLHLYQSNGSDAGTLKILTTGNVQLESGVTQSVMGLLINGIPQESGLWGSTSSAAPASHQDNTHFSLSGVVSVGRGIAGGAYLVNPDATATPHDGLTWNSGFLTLDAALAVPPASGAQVWVKGAVGAGKTYVSATTNTVPSGVGLYGGFAGTEATTADRDARPFRTYISILSGDVGGNDTAHNLTLNKGDNRARIVTLAGSTVLDGFRIKGANLTTQDGAVNVNGAGVTVRHCVFIDNKNTGGYGTGGIYAGANTPVIDSCAFYYNFAEGASVGGGGAVSMVYTAGGSVSITNCLFSGNSGYCGAVGGRGINVKLMNCTFNNNSSGVYGANNDIVGTWANPSIVNACNCIFWGATAPAISAKPQDSGSSISVQYCDIKGGIASGVYSYATNDLGHNISGDPLFVNALGADGLAGTLDDDLLISSSSPSIDAGTDVGAPAIDYAGASRPLDGNGDGNSYYDIGAYERLFTWDCLATVGDNGGTVDSVPADGSVLPGNSITFTAHPHPGLVVDRWEDPVGSVAQSGGATYTINNVLASHAVVVFFKADTGNARISVQTAPAGVGLAFMAGADLGNLVTYNGAYDFGWATGSSHALKVDDSTPQMISGSQYNFTGWSSGANPQTYIASGDATLTANFAVAYGLSLSVNSAFGTVSSTYSGTTLPGPGPNYYPPSQDVTITATPVAGSVFTGWSGDTVANATNATTLINMGTGPKSVTANFTKVIRVDAAQASDGDGTGWGTSAYKYLANALAAASDGDEVWVRAGTYYPATSDTLSIPANVDVYGGFSGDELKRDQRHDPTDASYQTILSGDIDGDTVVNSGNSRKIVLMAGDGATLDGFIVEKAYDSTGDATLTGKGVDLAANNLTVRNCIIRNCTAERGALIGGAPGSLKTGILVENCILTGARKYSSGNDTAAYLYNLTMTINNCVFYDNDAGTAHDGASWEFRHYGDLTLQNTILWDVTSSTSWHGGFKRNDADSPGLTVNAYNCDVKDGWVEGTAAFYQGTSHGGMLSGDPMFKNAAAADFRLTGASPCLEAASNTLAAATDIRGIARPQPAGMLSDIGAYEMVLPVISNTPATAVTAAGATLNGHLYSTGGGSPAVEVYYGTIDRGMTTLVDSDVSGWLGKVTLSGGQSVGDKSAAVSLAVATNYYYRYFATNAASGDVYWSRPAMYFVMPGTYSRGYNLDFELGTGAGWVNDGGKGTFGVNQLQGWGGPPYVTAISDNGHQYMFNPYAPNGSSVSHNYTTSDNMDFSVFAYQVQQGASYRFSGYYNRVTSDSHTDNPINYLRVRFYDSAGVLCSGGPADLTSIVVDADESTWEPFTFAGSIPVNAVRAVFEFEWQTDSSSGRWVRGAIDDCSFTVTAYRSDAQAFTWSASPSAAGSVTVNGNAVSQTGTRQGGDIVVNAAPIDGYRFVSWSGDVPAAHTNDQSFTLTMDSAKNIAATFALDVANKKTWHVDGSVSSSGDGYTSWATAFKTLQEALTASRPGDDILVAAGTYKPASQVVPFQMAKPYVNIYGGYPVGGGTRDSAANLTILSGDLNNDDAAGHASSGTRAENADTIVYVNAPVTLDGFVISGGGYNENNTDSTGGGGMIVDSAAGTPVIRNCMFVDNIAGTYAGAVLVNTPAEPDFVNCQFLDNCQERVSTAPMAGAAVYVASGSTVGTIFDRCTFAGNNSSGDNGGSGVYVLSGLASFTNCLVVGNLSGSGSGGGIKVAAGTVNIVNSTLGGNSGVTSGGAIQNAGTMTVKNSILWGDTTEIGGTAPTVSYSDVSGGYAGTANLNADPLFAYKLSGTYSSGSTYIRSPRQTTYTVGNTLVPNAYKGMLLNPNTAQNRRFLVASNGVNTITIWGDAAANSGTAFRIDDYKLVSGSPCVDAATTSGAPGVDLAGTTRTAPYDMGAYEGAVSKFTGATMYVKTTGTGSGASWADAASLQSALAASATHPQEIWVAAGTYKPGAANTDTFTLPASAELYGGFAGTESARTSRNPAVNFTILSGDLNRLDTVGWGNRSENVVHVVSVSAAYVGLDGFVISGGYGVGCALNIVGVSPTVKNTVICNNYNYGTGGDGGAVEITGGSPVFDHCVFADNKTKTTAGAVHTTAGSTTAAVFSNCVFCADAAAWKGGACYFEGNSTPYIVNCLFAGNGAYSPAYGGAIACEAGNGMTINAQIVNSTFSGNAGDGAVHAYNNTGSANANLLNCIVWTNDSSIVQRTGGNVTAAYSDVQGGWAGGAGMKNADPLFVTIGSWTGAGTYDGNTRQTRLTVSGVNWTPNAYAGKLLRVTSSALQYYIVTNDATSVTVWGDAAAGAFQVYDYRLKGGSPGIDAGSNSGAPATDIRGATRSGTVDMGAYEGSVYKVTVTPSIAGRAIVFDGLAVTAATDIYKESGASYTASASATESAGSGSQYVFKHWNLDGGSDVLTTSISVSVGSANRTLTGTFGAQYQLSLATSGSGTVSGGVDGSWYDSGTTLTLTPSGIGGWQFVGWSGDLTGTTRPAGLLMDAAKSVTATFSLDLPGTSVIFQ